MWHFIRWYKFLSAVKVEKDTVIKSDIAMTFMVGWQYDNVKKFIESKEEWSLMYE